MKNILIADCAGASIGALAWVLSSYLGAHFIIGILLYFIVGIPTIYLVNKTLQG